MSKRFLSILAILILFVVSVPVTTGQDNPTVVIDLTPDEGNPVLSGTGWNAALWFPIVVYHDGLFHMLFTGTELSGGHPWLAEKMMIGYATSEDGLNWTEYEGNPVFELDEAMGKLGALVGTVVEDDVWVMYVCPLRDLEGGCTSIYRATTPDPPEPWTVDPEPVLERSQLGAWDWYDFMPGSIMKTPDGDYVMYYYDGGVQTGTKFGMATSPDGITWTKYDDPATTHTSHASSDPVMEVAGGIEWEAFNISSPCVWPRDEGWEMFYIGGEIGESTSVGYATSPDGIIWTRFPNNPVLDIQVVNPVRSQVLVVDGIYYVYYMTWFQGFDIAVATGTVTWE